MRFAGTLGLVCSRCDPGLPAWQEFLLGLLALAIACALFYGLSRLGFLRSRMRNTTLRVCFLGIQFAWAQPDAAERLAPYVTAELGERLRGQLAETASQGRTIHHERPRIEKLTVISGGGPKEVECVARIRSSVRHWLTDASGIVVSGSLERSHDEATWRFVRDPERDWIAAEIEFAPAEAAAQG